MPSYLMHGLEANVVENKSLSFYLPSLMLTFELDSIRIVCALRAMQECKRLEKIDLLGFNVKSVSKNKD